MNRDFVLAATFAAAVHGALLFGFPQNPRAPAPVPREKDKGSDIPMPPPEIEVKLVEDPYVEPSASKDLPPPPVPTLPDSPMIDPTITFVQPVAPLQPFDPNVVTRVVPQSAGIYRPDGGAGIGRVVPIDLLDNSPRTRLQPSPVYPHPAKAQGLSGDVMVEFMVDESGRVHDPRVVSSTDRVFEENALRAVAKWVFEPGKRNGQVVRFRMSVPIVFRLND